jgi:hypothetical protein
VQEFSFLDDKFYGTIFKTYAAAVSTQIDPEGKPAAEVGSAVILSELPTMSPGF